VFKPLLILNSMDIIAKLFRRSGWIGDLKQVLISFSLKTLLSPDANWDDHVNPEGNKQIRERKRLSHQISTIEN